MLSHIQIRDFAIIDQIELELDGGLTVLSGETGAGKSILVDALTLVLGTRADAGMIRHGAPRADITAIFDLPPDHVAVAWLKEQTLDATDECIVRRTIQDGGRSRAYVNGRAVPLQTLRELGELLADIHGQHEHQTLTKRKTQKALLDGFAGHDALLGNVATSFGAWQTCAQRLAELTAAQADREDRLELLRYQVQELDGLNLKAHELDDLEDEHRKLANVGRLLTGVQTALSQTDEEDGIRSLLSRTTKVLGELSQVDPKIQTALALFESAEIQISEATSELSSYLTSLDVDPGRLEWVEKRLGSIEELARKHRISASDLPDHFESLKSELAQLDNAELHLSSLQEDTQQAEKAYLKQAKKLTTSRKKAAQTLAGQVTNMMQTLGMPGGKFEVSLNALLEGKYGRDGMDVVEYEVSANPGQPLRPLSKVASGGELARISLAIQVIAATTATNTTMVFDEVDSGVGGGVAEMVGRQLRSLGEKLQVLCVTHLPQVASQAHHHVRVSKLTDGKQTRTSLNHLSPDETIEEVARMLGGVDITPRTREHAREMLAANKG